MARLTKVYNPEDSDSNYVGRRHLPLIAGDKLMMLMDLNSKGLVIDSPQIRGRELEEFSRKFNLLTETERRQSLEIDSTGFISVMNQCVQCVGCRRRVERLFHQLSESGHRALDPLEVRPTCTLGITEEKLKTPQALGTLLYRHHEVLNNLLDNKLRSKTRCVLHSMDAFRAKPFSETWREVWSAMKNNCRTELAIIETKELHDVLESYLKKHKFCAGCRTKIERAYKILIGEVSTKEKGYAAQLYAHIRRCVPDQHIHVSTNKIEFLDALIKRAEPELNGSYSKLRERHAKTLEIAQEEVLTCVGMIMYERLRRIYVSLREEERACQVLAAVGVHALCRSFDTFVEQKQGISNLELLYQEISRAEKAKELKREQKKLKKKKKKSEKKNQHRLCEDKASENEDDDDVELSDVVDDDIFCAEDEDMVNMAETLASEELLSNLMPPTLSDEIEGKATKSKKQPKKKKQKSASKSKKSIEHHHLCENKADAGAESDDEDEDDLELIDVVDDGIFCVEGEEEETRNRTEETASDKVEGKATKSKSKKQAKKTKQHSVEKNDKESLDHDEQLDVDSCISSNAGNLLSSSQQVDSKCDDCQAPIPNCPCEHDVRDSGYGSDPTSHANSRTSSVVSCSEGLCNHDGLLDEDNSGTDITSCHNYVPHMSYGHQIQLEHKFSLLQMCDDFDDYDKDDENCYIPQEVVLAYQYDHEKVQRQREQLRATLRQNFERLCLQRGVYTATTASVGH